MSESIQYLINSSKIELIMRVNKRTIVGISWEKAFLENALNVCMVCRKQKRDTFHENNIRHILYH